MVTVDYFGRTGNNLFQWVFARLIALKNGLAVASEPPKTFLSCKPCLGGQKVDGKAILLSDGVRHDHNIDMLNVDYRGKRVHCKGYFQNVLYYNPYRAHIREWFDLPEVQTNYDDIVIHLRLTDYYWIPNRSVISPEYYLKILRREKFRKCYVVVEPHQTNEKYLRHFKGAVHGIEVVTQSPAEDFHFMRSFDRIVCSNSTFAWWAAFLSTARKIWTFGPWMNGKGIPLAGITGACVMEGKFLRDRELEKYNWTDYWGKPWPLPKI